MARKYRVGIEFVPKDKLTKALTGYSRKFQALHLTVERFKKLFGSFDAEGAKALREQLGQIKGIGRAIGGNVATRRQEIRIAALSAKETAKVKILEEKLQGLRMVNMAKLRGEQAKVDGIRRIADERHRQELEKSRALAAKVGGIQQHYDDLHEQATRRQEILETNLETAAHRKAIAEDRVLRIKERQRRELERETKDQAKLIDLTERFMAKIPNKGNRIGGGMAIAGGAFGALKGLYDTTHDESYRHYQTAQNGLLQMLKPGDQAQAQAAIRRLQGMSGMGLAESVETVKDLINVKGSIEEVTKGNTLSNFAKFMVQNRVAYGMNEQQGYSAAKAAELLMNQRSGRGFDQSLDLVQKVMAGTGGKVGGSDLLNFAKTAQSARAGLSKQGLMGLVPIIQEMGGSRAGTALMSVMQNLANGRASHASAQNLMDLGLVDPSMVELDKNGRMKRIKPGGVKGDDLLRADPLKWVETYLMPKTRGMDQAQTDRMINSILGQRTAAGLVTAMITQNSRIHKDMGIVSGSAGINGGYEKQMNTLPGSEEAMTKSWEKLRGKVADSVAPVLTPFFNSLSHLIDAATGFANKHPGLTSMGIRGGAIGLGIAGLAGTAIAGKGVLDAFNGLRSLGKLGGSAGGGLATELGEGVAAQAGEGLLAKMGGILAGQAAKSSIVAGAKSIGSTIARSSMGIAVSEMGTGLATAMPMILTSAGVIGAAALVGIGIAHFITDPMFKAVGKAIGKWHPEWFGGISHEDTAKTKASLDYYGTFNAMNRDRKAHHLPMIGLADYQRLHPLAAAAVARGRAPTLPTRPATVGSHHVTVPVSIKIQHGHEATAAATADAVASKAYRIIRDKVEDVLSGRRPSQPAPNHVR